MVGKLVGIHGMILWRNVENYPKLSYMSSVVRKPAFAYVKAKGQQLIGVFVFAT